MSDLVIRPAQLYDAEPIVAANLALARETEGKRLDAETVRGGVRALIENPARGFYLVAELAGRVVGQLMVTREWSDWRNADFWWIQSVYVHPDERRRGIFHELYRHLVSEAQRAGGVCGLRLYVEHENQAAQETYASLGLRRTDYHLYEVAFAAWE